MKEWVMRLPSSVLWCRVLPSLFCECKIPCFSSKQIINFFWVSALTAVWGKIIPARSVWYLTRDCFLFRQVYAEVSVTVWQGLGFRLESIILTMTFTSNGRNIDTSKQRDIGTQRCNWPDFGFKCYHSRLYKTTDLTQAPKIQIGMLSVTFTIDHLGSTAVINNCLLQLRGSPENCASVFAVLEFSFQCFELI